MKRMTIGRMTALLAVLSACGAFAGARKPIIELQSRAVVQGETIALRDVAKLSDDAPDRLGKLELGNAPWPGHQRQISRVLLRIRMASQGYRPDRYELTGAEKCSVALAAERIETKELLTAARRFLRDRYRDAADVSSACVAEPEPVLVEEGDGEIDIRPGIRDRGRGEVTVRLELVRDGKLLESASARFRVTRRKKVVVAAERIGRGTSPDPGAVRMETREVARIRGTPLTSPGQLEGAETVRAISAGEVVTRGMLKETQDPIVVRANERVRLVGEGRGLRITTVGRALSTARKGERVTAENARSGRRVSGVAVEDGRVMVNVGGDGQ